ncbi:hypothetical protein RM863_05715 [Streptomyces sp. DSM 41014]|uniref:PH domain-containing protein n=1 Tax=Streptomyces hintoniae TaxID=3075521 RepID=A0ABU2UED4_9ACTN|nr:hypothetical protein [Streptomyces sp. DSM 41014]MDT0471620.1 hypothetical protein [Streptomyces sp. DSM 41014]
MSWTAITLIWFVCLMALSTAMEHENYRDAFHLAASLLGVTSLLRRMGTCRIVLRESSIQVDNFFTSRSLAYTEIQRVNASPGCGLQLLTHLGEAVDSFAFGGSYLDFLFHSSERAAAEVDIEVRKRSRRTSRGRSGRRPSGGGGHSAPCLRRRWTMDGLLLIAVVCVAVGFAV